MRTIRPKDEQDESSGSLKSVPTAPKPAKRRCISSACIPCRKRKSKCDGGMPNCSTCIAVYQTPCSYDVDSDHRRKAALKRDIETLKGEKDSLGVIVAAIKTLSDTEVADIVQQIRAEEDLENLAETLKKNVNNVMLLERSNTKSVEGDLSNLIGHPSLDAAGVAKHYGHTSSLGLVSFQGQSPSLMQASEPWTKVTQDNDLVKHLMELYFCWSHPFYTLFSKELFLADMARNQNKYCSPLLVNAILAVGCQYSDRGDARAQPTDPSTVSDHFFTEAKRLLLENESSCLTTVQALGVMGLREASCNRDSSGFLYMGRCVRMLIELGLHLSFGASSDKISPTELGARKVTFWGCFILETAWSICIGRISQLPRAAINLDPPNIIEQYDMQAWKPYSDHGFEDVPNAEQPILTHTFNSQLSKLTEIVNDTVFMFYAPHERFTSKKLLEYNGRYKRWYSNLPATLKLRDVSSPHVLVLHMYYHTVVLHLFRPFLKVDLTNSQISPREICTSSANSIAGLFSNFRQTYGMRRVPVLLTHIILSSSIIHLLDLPNPTSATNLALSITGLREMTANHSFCARCLQIILKLAIQWNIHLPLEVSQAAYDMKPETMISIPTRSQNSQGADHYLSPVSERSLQQDHILNADFAGETPFAALKHSPKPSANTGELFWSPFPDQSVPLQANPPGGPMDINAMLDVPNDWDQLNRDGFRPMAAISEPILGPPHYGQMHSHWSQA